MKILQINASYKPAFIYGGPTMSVSKLSEVLVRNNFDLEVLTTTANGDKELEIEQGSRIKVEGVTVSYFKRVTKDHTHFSPALYLGLLRTIEETRGKIQDTGSKKQEAKSEQIIHIHTWWNLVSVISCLIAVLKSVPVVLSPRGTLSSYSFGNKNNFIKNIIFQLTKPLLNHCHFHVTSENEKKAISGLVKPKGIWVIPNLVNLPGELKVGCELWGKKQQSGSQETGKERQKTRGKSQKLRFENQEVGYQEAIDKNLEARGKKQESSSERQVGEDKFKLLFLSRIEEKKGLELLFSALRNIDLNYHLNIAGSGDEGYVEQLKKLSESLDIDRRISWIGQQSAEQKFDLMAAHDLLVLPSHDENFANVVIESLAMGTAVLITENVGLSDYVKDQDLGWVCKFDQEDLRYSLIQAAKDSIKLGRVRETAPGKIREDFSDDKLVERYIEMYRRIAEEEFS